MILRILMSIVLGALLVSCSGGGHKTLGDLEYRAEKETKIEFEKLTHGEVREEYQELLSLFKDKELKEQIERRIAEVYMIEGENAQIAAKPTKSHYAEAIKSYHEILKKYPGSPDNADVLYQLAKAYDLEGESEKALKMLNQLTSRHVYYKNNDEAHFRKGDIYFNQEAYRKAETEYQIVTQLGDDKLKTYAYYMLGWTHYKQFDFGPSLDAFAYVLNYLMEKTNNSEELTNAEKPLIQDTINSMSLSLAKNGGGQAIADIKLLKGRPHIWMIYDNLGDYYLKKERFEDSADTYRLYVSQFNSSKKAPELHSKLISTYIKGGFPLQALKEKETYVEYYGLNSQYAANAGGIPGNVKNQLNQYLGELASHYHSQGQQYQKLLANSEPSVKKSSENWKKAVAAFDQAAHFYQEYIVTFPSDKRVGEITYLKGEVLFAAERFDKAIADYEKVAYQLNTGSGKKYAAKAGYAAIISYQKYIDILSAEGDQQKRWQAQAVDSMLRFAEVYHQDKRSPSVLTNAAEYLFGLDQYQRAYQVASDLIKNNQKLDKSLKQTAYGIAAHSSFKLNNFQEAENNYFKQRSLTKRNSQEYQKISERLATAIYKKSEQFVTLDKKQDAIAELLKIKSLAPNSIVRVTAQYDAATMLLGLESWKKAIVELKELEKTYPKHKLATEFPRKLAFAYEKNQQWKEAAEYYLGLSKKDPDSETRRDALFIAADMYEKSEQYDTAIKLFRQYARAYEQPFEVRMEARYHLATLYGKTNDISKQLFWLRRIIDGDKKAGEQRNERSQWLGAWANIKYGDYFASEFRKIRLRQPLVKSIQKKNKSLEDAVGRYQKAADYGILEFVTMSSYQIAELYQRFARDLRKSPKPRGLSPQERVAYAEIIEEQAAPFDELAAELHYANIERAWAGEFNPWIDKSFDIMSQLIPARFGKTEIEVSYGDEIR